MNLTSTADGGIELHLEHQAEWLMVASILHDANRPGFDLAAAVGARMADTEDWEDWSEWVLPDLREGFQQHLRTVAAAIEVGAQQGFIQPGTVVIPRDAFFDWYAALNQARLALESKYQFGQKSRIETEDTPTKRGAAHFRSQFYNFLQAHLLDRGLG
ncbi:MAG: hypothetical protein K9N23_15515 [Akkermansiaceae bacterium]|nr:hypothetical protein [Akkermansiaceae bacterium]MCF7733097.1 hypothetical protein [Akkermansiaceae bacterium]